MSDFTPEQESRFGALEDKAELINSNMETILSAIVGNKFTGKGGIVMEMQNLEKKIQESDTKLLAKIDSIEKRLNPVEDYIKRANWTFMIIAGVATFVGAVIGLAIAYFSLIKK